MTPAPTAIEPTALEAPTPGAAVDAGGAEQAGADGVGGVPKCPVCGREAQPGDRFCEVDGAPLGQVARCSCGGTYDHDGFCSQCGMKAQTTVSVIAPAPDLAAATHVGRTHDVNQDAIAVARRERGGAPAFALVVCDGVTSSSHGEQAAAAAADGALAVLSGAAVALLAAAGGEPVDGEATVREAAVAAHRAACTADIAPVEGKQPAGATLVAALVANGRIDVTWVGDSRAYLLRPDGTALPLTHDHSWVNQVVDGGLMTEAEAMRSPYAHAITHCIGPLEDPDPDKAPEPSVGHVVAEPGSRLLLCSDGLWNYASSPEDIAALVAEIPAGSDAETVAQALVERALELGGHDDVSVAVAVL